MTCDMTYNEIQPPQISPLNENIKIYIYILTKLLSKSTVKTTKNTVFSSQNTRAFL